MCVCESDVHHLDQLRSTRAEAVLLLTNSFMAAPPPRNGNMSHWHFSFRTSLIIASNSGQLQWKSHSSWALFDWFQYCNRWKGALSLWNCPKVFSVTMGYDGQVQEVRESSGSDFPEHCSRFDNALLQDWWGAKVPCFHCGCPCRTAEVYNMCWYDMLWTRSRPHEDLQSNWGWRFREHAWDHQTLHPLHLVHDSEQPPLFGLITSWCSNLSGIKNGLYVECLSVGSTCMDGFHNIFHHRNWRAKGYLMWILTNQ